MRLVGHVASMTEVQSTHKTLVRKPEGEKPLGRSRHRWEDNIKVSRKYVKMWTGFVWLRIGFIGRL
jgi:hypothetical protein